MELDSISFAVRYVPAVEVCMGITSGMFAVQSMKWNSIYCGAVNVRIDVPAVWRNSWLSVQFSENDVVNACVELLKLHFHCVLQLLIITLCPLKFQYERMHCIQVLRYFLQNESKHKWKLQITKLAVSKKYRCFSCWLAARSCGKC
jgi:hypothetical protein